MTTNRKKVVLLGTPIFAERCFAALIADSRFEVVGLVSQPDRPKGRELRLTPSPVKALALAHNLPILTPQKINSEESLALLTSWGAEAAVVVAFGQILSERFLALFPKGSVNIHASLLPRWRGAAPIQRALEAGDHSSGVCLQRIVRELDAGDLIGQRRIDLTDSIDALELHDRLIDLSRELLTNEFHSYLEGQIQASPQDTNFVTYAKKIEKNEELIDWRLPAVDIHNRIRAFVMGPGTYTHQGARKLKIWKSKLTGTCRLTDADAGPGAILGRGEEGVLVKTGEGVLEILEVQPESKSRMRAQGYQFLVKKLGADI